MSNIPKKRKITGNQGIDNFLNQVTELSKPTSGSDFMPTVGAINTGLKVGATVGRSLLNRAGTAARQLKGYFSSGSKVTLPPINIPSKVTYMTSKATTAPELRKTGEFLGQNKYGEVRKGLKSTMRGVNSPSSINQSAGIRQANETAYNVMRNQGVKSGSNVGMSTGKKVGIGAGVTGAVMVGQALKDSFGVLRSDANPKRNTKSIATRQKQMGSGNVKPKTKPVPKPKTSSSGRNFARGSATERANVDLSIGSSITVGSRGKKATPKPKSQYPTGYGSRDNKPKAPNIPTQRTQHPTGYGSRNLRTRK